MLPLLHNRLQVILGAYGVYVSRSSSNQNVDAKYFQSVFSKKTLLSWQLAADCLEELLTQLNLKPHTRLTIILSSEFVRYLLLPPQKIMMNDSEKHAYAIASYQEVYDEEMSDWIIKKHETGFKQASFAAAVNINLLDELKRVAQKNQLKLVGIQPYLMEAYNNSAYKLSKLNGFFVVNDATNLMIIKVLNGVLKKLHICAIQNDWQKSLKIQLVRESMIDSDVGREVLLYAPSHIDTITIESWQVSRIGKTQLRAFQGDQLIVKAA